VSASNFWAGLELRHLLALQSVAENSSFSKAGRDLGYTQSGISQQIAALERIVGERLVERPGGPRQVRLTEAGHVLLRHVRAVLDEITAARADVAALRNGSGGVLRVGAFQSVSTILVPTLMKRLAHGQPALQIELVQTTCDSELFAKLESGELDISFALLPLPPGPFVALEILSDPFVVTSSPEFAASRQGRPMSMHELCDVPLIAEAGCRYFGQLELQMRERGLKPNVAYRFSDNGTMQALVADGAGVAVVAQLVAHSVGGSIAVIELEEDFPPRRIALSWRGDRELPRSREIFVRAVQETCFQLGLAGGNTATKS
jgi:DNA-binding transcriptional LysR family regulator